MTTQQVADRVLAWVMESCPDLEGGYDFIPSISDQPLPDAVVDVERIETSPGDRRFPQFDIEQAWLMIFPVAVSIMVDNSDTQAAATQLRVFADQLRASLMRDGSLGGRVPLVSPFFAFDFTPPFVERADGTRGREMTMAMVVAEPIQEDM